MISRVTRISALIVVMALLYPGQRLGFRMETGVTDSTRAKSIETYWSETDLSEFDLLRFLTDETCLDSQRDFLACVNSISSMAERMKLKFRQDGAFETLSPEDMESRLTEKTDLSGWKDVFDRPGYVPPFSFLELWLQLKARLNNPEKINALMANGINAYLSVARDPHTYIVPLAYYEEVLSQSESRAPHLGFVARRIKGGAIVRKVFTDSPAARAGLKKGDRIIELNGEPVSRLHSAEFSELIRGQSAGRLLLKVERTEAQGRVRREFEILQGETKLISVESRILNQSSRLGLLTIHKFARETCQTAKKQLIALMEQSIQGLILDLRDNPGGQVDEAACISGLFLQPGTAVFHTKYLDPLKNGEMYWSEGAQVYAGPMAILINSGSASAAEIVAGALKDLSRATLVGERSFGKGSFQDGTLWRQQSKIALFQTQGFYYFPSGWTPQIVGLEPDIPVKLTDTEAMREEDLYLLPLRPLDLWTGPQSLSWTSAESCDGHAEVNANGAVFSLDAIDEDAQLQTATDWVKCNSKLAKTSGL